MVIRVVARTILVVGYSSICSYLLYLPIILVVISTISVSGYICDNTCLKSGVLKLPGGKLSPEFISPVVYLTK